MTSKITPLALNTDCLEKLTSFLTIYERASLRSSCTPFSLNIPDLSEEAKTFLVFESKLPLIQNIIRRTKNYNSNFLYSGDYWILSLSQQHELLSLRRFPKLVSLYGGVFFLPLAIPILLAILADRFNQTSSPVEDPSQIAARIQLAVITTLSLLIIAIPIAVKTGSALEKRHIRNIHINALRNLWQEYRNQPPPQNLIAAEHYLRDQLEHHRRLSAAYAAAGGMDRHYTTSGLDSALAEIRARR
jgi:hypothetical protein